MSSTTNIRKSVFELLIRLVFVVLPTMAVSAYVLGKINLSYTGFDSGTLQQYTWLFAGIAIAYLLSWLRGRFLVMSLIVLGILWVGRIIVSNLPGEFDVFYTQAKYWLYSTLFTIGWLAGFLIGRSRFFVVTWCSLLMLCFIVFLSGAENINVSDWTEYLIPVFLYAVYMMFLVPQILSSSEWTPKKTIRWVSVVLFFLLLATSAFLIAERYFKSDIEATQRIIDNKKGDKEGQGDGSGKNGLGPGYDEKNGLMERGGSADNQDGNGNDGSKGNDKQDGKHDGQGGNQGNQNGNQGNQNGNQGNQNGNQQNGGKDNKDGNKGNEGKDNKGNNKNNKSDDDGYKMKDSMKMGEKQSQSDVLMFCSRLNNYFPDGTPQPIYFVYHYLTKYDPKSETFVRDPLMPNSDELSVDPSKIDMYRSKVDSTPIKNSFANKKRKVIDADVFISANVWKHSLLAPSAPFSVQTIPVDTGYKDLFRSGYHVKCYTSELNNAYLVYNPSANPQIAAYQKERIDELNTVKDYSGVDSTYYRYYTTTPQGSLFDSIRALAIRVTATAKTPIEKVIAIRDYFLQTKPDGSYLYKYTLDPGAPGDPNIPTGGMLRDFLFKTHAGYCTYYAGASTLMLQAIGIPARFTTGFATIDRSDKNKGWYWFYASQAHAWTQVFFPGYGWLDFDMTISSQDDGGGVQQAPKPDGTPPVPPPQPWLIVDGVVTEEPDPATKQLKVKFDDLIFFNDEYHLDTTVEKQVDATLCRFVYGNIDTTFGALHKGDSVFVVSWDDMAKDVPDPDPKLSIEQQMKSFPWPMIADEIYIQKKVGDKPKEAEKKDQEKKQEAKTDWRKLWFILFVIGAAALLAVVLFPVSYRARLMWRVSRARSIRDRAEAVYRAALYTYHMSGHELQPQTSLSYAQERVDPFYGTHFAGFLNIYLRLKYSTYVPAESDDQVIRSFHSAYRAQVRSKLNFVLTSTRWFNLARALRYFRDPDALTNPDNFRDVNNSYGA